MLETMYDAPGIGLAAVQIGILKRIVVIDISKDEKKKEPLFLVNPEIIYRSKDFQFMKRDVCRYQANLPK